MNRPPSGADSMRRRSIMAVVVMVVLALLGGNAHAIAASPAPVFQLAAANDDPPGEVDEEHEFYKQLVQDIADYAEDVEVRDAAKAALADNTKEKLIWFLDHGQAEAQARADQRKRVERAENRKKVEEWARTGGPNVRARAQAALNAGDQAIADFVAYGYEIALKQDKQQAEDDKAEQERIIGRVHDMVARGGPQVKVEGEAVLALGDYSRIREFYLTGYHEANKRDHEFQEVIEKALEDRNRALTELDQLARRSEAAAKARAEIMRANINAVKALDDVVFAMQMGVKAAHKADQIFQEDKPRRANGHKGRDREIDSLRAEAAEYAARADRTALEAESINVQVHNAASRLVETGLTNGLDWAKVTIGMLHAVEASALAAETSQHATVATLADSRALDADRNAQEHANNAHKYRAEAERQKDKAIELAAAAKVQHDIAIAARDRAEQEKNLAADKVRQAQGHAANARTARVNAQNAAANAAAKAKDAAAAHNNAAQLRSGMDAATRKAQQIEREVQVAETVFSRHINVYNQLARELEEARKKAEETGGEAWDVVRRIEGEANAARGAADQAEAWAGRARSAAATARAEAQRAAEAANAAQTAAARANSEAVTARRAADETHRIALQTTNAAIASKDAADHTRSEAEAAVREANQAVFQSVIADRAASAASASAEMVIDPARAAEAILKPYAAINADARKALAAIAEALLISEEQSRAAREKATEAGQAAIRARKAADEAVADVKPAYEAAAQAANAANQAAQHALAANDAANAAAQHASSASSSAAAAARWANSARADAVIAGDSANAATAAAAAAGQSAAAAESILDWAVGTAAALDDFAFGIDRRLNEVKDIRHRYDEAKRLAQAEAERKRQELNKKTVEMMFFVMFCPKSGQSIAKCQELADRAGDKARRAVDRAGDYVTDYYHCSGGDEQACARYRHGVNELKNFLHRALVGFAESVIASGVAWWDGMKCFARAADDGNWSQCMTIVDDLKYMRDNPYTWIQLDVWESDPGYAFGSLMFDVGVSLITLRAGGVGGAASRSARLMAKAVDGGSGRLSKLTADLHSFKVRLHDSVRDHMPNPLAEILNLKARFENGEAKFDSAIAVVDGHLYRMEPFTLRPNGSPNLVDGATIRLEGGTLRIENGAARLDGTELKVDPPKPCAVGVTAMAAANDCGTGADPTPRYPEPKVVDGEYRHDVGDLKIRLSKTENDWADEQLAKAAAAEKNITEAIKRAAVRAGGTRYGEGKELKSAESFKRKMFEEGQTKDGRKPISEIAPEMNDSVRYTIVFGFNDYTNGFFKAMDELGKNYELVKLKNHWKRKMGPDGISTGYPGINVTFRTSDGLLFELQIHTPEALLAKDRETPNYEKRRSVRAALAALEADKSLTPDERTRKKQRLEAEEKELEERRNEIWGDVPRPVGAILIREVPDEG